MANEKRLIVDEWSEMDSSKLYEQAMAATFKKHLIEVVPCKECKWKRFRGDKELGYFYCFHKYGLRSIRNISTDFCSHGERGEAK